MGVGEPGEEARAVEVGVRADLEVDHDAARGEPQRIVEVRVVAHHGPEHHLVVAALRAAEAAAHPGLQEDRAALDVPARRGEARDRQVAVEQRLGVLRLRRDLAEEEARASAGPPCEAMSPVATWTSSWFISEYMRSAAEFVSNAWERRGDVEASRCCAAQPRRRRCRSRRSPSADTPVRWDGIQPNIRRCHASELVNVRTACGTR